MDLVGFNESKKQICKYLIALILIHFSYVQGDVLEIFKTTESVIIHEVLEEANKNIFLPELVRFELLNENPSLIPTLAQWQYNDWHSYDVSLTLGKLINGFETQSINGPSFTIVALKEGKSIGSISLDQEGEVEFADLWGKGPWLGSFHVIPEERNNGIGHELGEIALTIAMRLGYTQVNFFTSNFSNVEKYLRKGAQIVEIRSFRGHMITIMKIALT